MGNRKRMRERSFYIKNFLIIEERQSDLIETKKEVKCLLRSKIKVNNLSYIWGLGLFFQGGGVIINR
jgi:hypothetical protein